MKVDFSTDYLSLSDYVSRLLAGASLPSIQETNPLVVANKVHFLLKDVSSEPLQRKIQADMHKAFRQQKALLDLNKILNAEKTPFLLIKGLALNQLLHGNKLCRPSLDIDLLVSPGNVFKTDEQLIAAGFKRHSPDFTLKDAQKRATLKMFDQFLYHHPESKINLELHWRLFRNDYILPLSFEELWANRQSIDMGPATFFTLSNSHYLAYLLLHAFQHSWERLMWMVDVYLLSKKLEKKEVGHFLELSKQYRFEKEAGVGFALIEMILKAKDLPTEIRAIISEKHREKAAVFPYYIPDCLKKSPNHESISYKVKRLLLEAEYTPGIRSRLFYLYNYPLFMYRYVQLPAALDFLYPLFWPYVFVRNKLK
ncbi:MAG: nucleotidyltransferase family protein [Flavobacteriales bacterium]